MIGPSDYHFYSGMGPGMLGKTYTLSEIRFATRHVVEKQGGRFLRDIAVTVLADEKKVVLASGETHSLDLIFWPWVFNRTLFSKTRALPQDWMAAFS